MHIDPGSDNHDSQDGSGGTMLTLIIAVIISVAIVAYIMSTSRRDAAALDVAPPAVTVPASAPTQPAPIP